MEGVMVLSHYQHIGFMDYAVLVLSLLFVAVFAWAISNIVENRKNRNDGWGKALAWSIVGLVLSLGLLAGVFELLCRKPMRYKVAVNNAVTFNDFMRMYDIVDQDGQIFIVEERSNDGR